MGSVGQQMLSGYGNMLGVHTQNKKGDSFTALMQEIEMEIGDARAELEYCKREVRLLTSERNKVSEQAEAKCDEINGYLNKELQYLEESMMKSM